GGGPAGHAAGPAALRPGVAGLGEDCHTASLFPGSEALAERRRLAVAPWVEKLGAHRITMTLPALADAARVLFLFAGADKAVALQRALEGDEPPERCPARAVVPPDGELVWLVDRDAAALLRSGTAGKLSGFS